jgi:hypothetical protein
MNDELIVNVSTDDFSSIIDSGDKSKECAGNIDFRERTLTQQETVNPGTVCVKAHNISVIIDPSRSRGLRTEERNIDGSKETGIVKEGMPQRTIIGKPDDLTTVVYRL